ncbi:MAG: DUF998 domain-containing protein [Bullifex sp.]
MEKTFRIMGLTGLLALLSYTAMVVISPSAYPGYDWMTMAVSELSADGASSQALANQLNALFGPCSVVCATLVFIASKKSEVRIFRAGITCFMVMEWVCVAGYEMFPWFSGDDGMCFQKFMHLAVTVAVVVLSLASLIMLVASSKAGLPSLGKWALAALIMMVAGPVGTGLLPPSVFGLFERLSTFSAVIFNAVLGLYLCQGRFSDIR